MIPQRNLSLLANRLYKEHGGRRIPEAVLERDYCLAWFLVGLSQSKLPDLLIFKGGTALKRCHFGDYRFSEGDGSPGRVRDRILAQVGASTGARFQSTLPVEQGIQQQRTSSAELQSPSTVCRKNRCGTDISNLKSSTAGLRLHDLRHHAITELAESQASDRTIMSIAGHVSQQMLAHYSHVRIESKRKALDALSVGVKAMGYDTNNVTKPVGDAILSVQLLEKNGGDDGTRTRGLCRDRAAF
jgi:Phage integrase family/Nucleotidyl transferase AbiEii toxin, Type IV TA system